MEKSNSTLTIKTIESILDYIKAHKLRKGDRLPTETAFLKELGVSRVILREAFSYLKGLGLIESKRGSAFKIAEVNFTDTMEQVLHHTSVIGLENIDELFELRHHLELGTIYEAVENSSESDIEAINSALEKLETLVNREEVRLRDFETAELEFHQAIMRPAKCKTLRIINSAVENFFNAFSNPDIKFREKEMKRLRRDHLEHKIIAYAFKLKWPDVAETALRKHLQKY